MDHHLVVFLDLALCGQKWTTDAAQPEAQKSSEEQKEKAPRKGHRTRFGPGLLE
jgi:hypothetical protein